MEDGENVYLIGIEEGYHVCWKVRFDSCYDKTKMKTIDERLSLGFIDV